MTFVKVLWNLHQLRRNAWRKQSQLLKIQEKKLRALAKYAYENVESYHKRFRRLGLKPSDINTSSDLQKLPILTRSELQDNSNGPLISRNIDPNKCTKYQSSGSTGIPVTVISDSKAEDFRAAIFGRPFFECGLRYRDKMLRITDPENWRRKRFYEYFGFLRTLYASPLIQIEDQLDAIERFNPDAIYGHSSFIFLLSKVKYETETRKLSPRLVFGTAELLSSKTRAFIDSVFGGKMFDLYGCMEVERIGWECHKHEGYHMDIDSVVVEFLKDGEPISPGESGQIVVTCLYNYAMPLIRYDTGDFGVPTDEKCSCGRGLPLMKNIDGRISDVITCPDGKVILPMAFLAVLDPIVGISQYQVVRETKNRILVKIVKGKNFTQKTVKEARSKVAKLVGENFEVEVAITSEVMKEASGKVKVVKSLVN